MCREYTETSYKGVLVTGVVRLILRNTHGSRAVKCESLGFRVYFGSRVLVCSAFHLPLAPYRNIEFSYRHKVISQLAM